ncbi:DUF2723 domain-containing protein [Sesbania bispinosa]|nr:DUF2723 domain-containing protein [Sesbania bispinosa]
MAVFRHGGGTTWGIETFEKWVQYEIQFYFMVTSRFTLCFHGSCFEIMDDKL